MVALGSVLSLFAVLRVGVDVRPVAVLLLWLAIITPILVRTDILTRRLPNRIVLPALAVAMPLTALDAVVRRAPVWEALCASLVVGGALYACAVFGGLGMGDVKLGALLGLTVGCFGVPAVVLFVTITICAAGIVGAAVVCIARGRGAAAGWQIRIPFGPFLLLGAWAAIAVVA
ncbi:Peptidase-A24 domain-containing protein [Plantibacter sp. RU18]